MFSKSTFPSDTTAAEFSSFGEACSISVQPKAVEKTASAAALFSAMQEIQQSLPKQEMSLRHHEQDGDALPVSALCLLDAHGLQDHYIPVAYGGSLLHYDRVHLLLRHLAGEDLTAAIAHAKTFLGAVAVWIAGDASQCRQLASSIAAGAVVSLGLTERGLGSDIGATATIARPGGRGYLIDGEKWLINNASRSDHIVVFARTGPAQGARSFSLFLAPGVSSMDTRLTATRKNLTHGVRGADISGVIFDHLEVPTRSLVGQPGAGLELVLKGFQVTRTLCAALSAGGAQAALRIGLAFTSQRRVGGRMLATVPSIGRTLETVCLDMLIVDILGLVGARAIDVLPGQMSAISAIVKAEVPERVEGMVGMLADIIGSRAFLEDDEACGAFAAIQRDLRLVAIFDGNTVVNLQALRLHLRSLGQMRRRAKHGDPEAFARLFDVSQPCPVLAGSDLKLAPQTADPVVVELPLAGLRVERMHDIECSLRGAIAAEASALWSDLMSLERDVLDARPTTRLSGAAFDQAETYARLFAAACCLHLFLGSREMLQPELRDGAWLVPALARLRNGGLAHAPGAYRLFTRLCRQGEMFTALQGPPAQPARRAA